MFRLIASTASTSIFHVVLSQQPQSSCSFGFPNLYQPAQATFKEKVLQMDLSGVISITAAVVCYLFALQWGGIAKKWSSSDVVGLLVGFGTLFVAFFINEWWQGERALLLPSIMKNRTIISGCIFSFL